MLAIIASVGMPPSIRRGLAGAYTTPASQDRHAHLGRRVTKHPELGRRVVQSFACVFTNDVTCGTATTCHILRRDHLFDTRQVFWLDATPHRGLCRASRLGRINGLVLCMDHRHGRLDLFQCKMVLIRMALLRLRAVKRALEVSEQFLQPVDAISLRSMIPSRSARVLFCALI